MTICSQPPKRLREIFRDVKKRKRCIIFLKSIMFKFSQFDMQYENKKGEGMKNVRRKDKKLIELDSLEIENLFDKSFQDVINSDSNKIQISQYDLSVRKENFGKEVIVEVNVYGLAGSTTRNEFKNRKDGAIIAGGEKINIEPNEDVGNSLASFEIFDVFDLNSNDYRLFYKLIN